MSALFDRAAQWTAKQSGHAHTFALAIIVVIVWAVSGPLFGFSDTWQLVINTGTTIVTFLMVFLIQNTQNRDTEALQLKLDELIRVSEQARNRLINLEDLTEDCRHRPMPYLNNVLEQDHRAIKRRVNASQHFRSFWGACRTIAGYEAIHMIRKGQAYGIAAGEKVSLLHRFILGLFAAT